MPENLSDALGELLAVPEQPEPLRRLEFDHAKGEGWLTTPPAPATDDVDFDAHLIALGYDPARYAVDANGVRTSVWEAQTKGGIVTMRAIRARVVARRPGLDIDADGLIDEIRRHKPRKKPEVDGEGTFVFVVSDLQIGKPDGDGTEGSVTRYLQAVDDAVAKARKLRRKGVTRLLIVGVGDLVEGFGLYANQLFVSELDRRQQARVARRLLVDSIARMAREFDHVTVAAVAGNHGEHRNVGAGGGKSRFGTTPDDNDDLAVFEQAADVLSANPDVYGHITWHLGGDPLLKQVEASGWIVGVTHGHIARESGTAEQKLRRWYERQAAGGGFHPHILVSGHYHHFRAASWGDRERRGCFWLQAPSTDGGSDWFQSSSGEASAPGVLTFCITPDVRVTDIAIL